MATGCVCAGKSIKSTKYLNLLLNGNLHLPNSGSNCFRLQCACVDIIVLCFLCHDLSLWKIFCLPSVTLTSWECFFFCFTHFYPLVFADMFNGANRSFFSTAACFGVLPGDTLVLISLLIALLRQSQYLPRRWAGDMPLVCCWHFCTSVVSNPLGVEKKKLLLCINSIAFLLYV